MYKNFSAFLLVMLLVISVAKAQDPGPPSPLGAGETYTSLWSISYDYQTNGSVRYLLQDPANASNWMAVLMGQPDSTTAAGTGRHVYYAYSSDAGATWTSDVIDVTVNQGFPCVSLSNGIPIIARHQSATVGSLVAKDLFFGAFGFSNVAGVPTITGNLPIWPHISGTANGNYVMAAAPNNTGAFNGHRTTYNGTSYSPYVDMSVISGPSGNFDVASNSNGKVCIVGCDYNAGTNVVRIFQSNDNGVTFDGGTVIFDYLVTGSDTIFASLVGGFQTAYVGDVPHVVFAAYNGTTTVFPNANTNEYVRPSIYQWSQPTGLKLIASKVNIPQLTDTITQVNMAPLTQPTITRTSDNKLVCAFTAFLRGNVQTVNNGDQVNAGEIFTSVSGDNGATWSTPVNQTNTPFVEEKHPSFAPVSTVTANKIGLYYIRDKKAGGWVNVPDWGLGPVWGIFKSMTLTGVKENVSVAKSYELFQNYPNPFNPTTTISYYVQKSGLVSIKVFDALGREVATLVNEIQTQGPREIQFFGDKLSSGIYYYSITAGDFKDTKKMMLIK